mmetsp:Transcript_116338/g.325405  ORF Transcript_116338/g.325405 Transcript_116338/m.325405 type:complete len:332 (+) Transcript_116338:203-1198(+)
MPFTKTLQPSGEQTRSTPRWRWHRPEGAGVGPGAAPGAHWQRRSSVGSLAPQPTERSAKQESSCSSHPPTQPSPCRLQYSPQLLYLMPSANTMHPSAEHCLSTCKSNMHRSAVLVVSGVATASPVVVGAGVPGARPAPEMARSGARRDEEAPALLVVSGAGVAVASLVVVPARATGAEVPLPSVALLRPSYWVRFPHVALLRPSLLVRCSHTWQAQKCTAPADGAAQLVTLGKAQSPTGASQAPPQPRCASTQNSLHDLPPDNFVQVRCRHCCSTQATRRAHSARPRPAPSAVPRRAGGAPATVGSAAAAKTARRVQHIAAATPAGNRGTT